MQISKEGIELIKDFEGFSAKAYQCSAGVWTLGYGSTDGVKNGDKITLGEAEKRLAQDLAYFEAEIDILVKVPLTQSQFDALVSFTYNVGVGALKKSTLLKRLNAGKYEEVPAQLMRWNKAGGKVLAGLVRRRQAEADLFNSDEPKQDEPFAQKVDAPEKPLVKSRTMTGAGLAGVASVAGEVVTEAKDQIEPLVPYADSLKLIFVLLALLGVGLVIYARISDRKKGVN